MIFNQAPPTVSREKKMRRKVVEEEELLRSRCPPGLKVGAADQLPDWWSAQWAQLSA